MKRCRGYGSGTVLCEFCQDLFSFANLATKKWPLKFRQFSAFLSSRWRRLSPIVIKFGNSNEITAPFSAIWKRFRRFADCRRQTAFLNHVRKNNSRVRRQKTCIAHLYVCTLNSAFADIIWPNDLAKMSPWHFISTINLGYGYLDSTLLILTLCHMAAENSFDSFKQKVTASRHAGPVIALTPDKITRNTTCTSSLGPGIFWFWGVITAGYLTLFLRYSRQILLETATAVFANCNKPCWWLWQQLPTGQGI